MRLRTIHVFLLATMTLLLFACGGQMNAGVPSEEIATLATGSSFRHLVVYQRSVPRDAEVQVRAAGGELVRVLPEIGLAVAVSADPGFAAAMSRVRGVASVGPALATHLPHVDVEVAVPAGPTIADDLFNEGLVWGIERVRAPAAWAAGHTGSHATVVAIIDTGIATNHPDLATNVVHSDCFVSTGSQATGACLAYPSLSDHGTHVAGTVAAAFDGGRVVGVGPNLGLASYNTFEVIPGCGVCTYSDARWAAMIDAANRGYDVINMSLGGVGWYGGRGSQDLALFAAMEKRVANYVTQRGTVLVASAGNSGLDLNGTWTALPSDTPGIVTVSATGIRPAPRYQAGISTDVLAFYSNFGATVDVAAPGGDCGMAASCDPATRPADYAEHLVLSTVVAPSPACAATASCAVGYGWKGGTSMAAPHVSGVAGLVRDAYPSASARQVVSIVLGSAERLDGRQEFGRGIVNAYDATR